MRQLLQGRVDPRAVQALRIIVDDQLPVGGDVVDDPTPQPELLHSPGSEPVVQPIELVLERIRLLREIQENVPVPEVHRDSLERVILHAEIGHAVHVRRGDKPTVQVISPGMIGTLNRGGERSRSPLAEPGTSVPADVMKRLDLVALASDEDDALPADLTDDEIAPVRDLLGSAGVEPHPEEEPLQLGSVVIRIDVISRRQAHRGGDLLAHRDASQPTGSGTTNRRVFPH